MNGLDEAVIEVNNKIDWLVRYIKDIEARFKLASDEGAKLAATVYSFVEDPEGVGTQSLRSAYGRFMGQHSANFCSLPLSID